MTIWNESEIKDYKKLQQSFMVDGKLLYVGRLLQRAYEKYAENIAIIDGDREISYKEFYFRSVHLSKKLKKYGINKGDKVAIYSGNSAEFYIVYFAIWQIGAVCVPLNIYLHEKELAFVLNDSQPVLIYASSSLAPKLEDVKKLTLLDFSPIILNEQDVDWELKVPKKKEAAFSVIEDLYSGFEIEDLDENELCLLLYTSGTTGKPKGVMLSSKNILSNVLQGLPRFTDAGANGNDRFFSVLPLFHVFAQNTCLWVPVITGSAAIIVRKIDRRFIREGLLKKPTVFLGFPALFGLLCLMKDAYLDTIKVFISGADAMPDKIRSMFALIYGRKICVGYGLTETSPVIGFDHINTQKSTDKIGRPFPGIECDVRDEAGNSLNQGQVGDLWVNGDNVMIGYYHAEEETKKVLQNGWLNTGDLCRIDSDGCLAITGRSKDVIIHKGFNIYPQEIENILMLHKSVFKVAVLGKDEDSSGQIPVAFVALKNKKSDDVNVLRQLCLQNLASYKVPRKFICLDDLPMSATGKTDKKQLLARLKQI